MSLYTNGVPPLQVQRGEEETEKPPPKRSSLSHEREKFFELLKSKYPEQTNGIEIDQLANGGPPSLVSHMTIT